MKCVLLQTKDNRKFFTYTKYHDQLIEYAKMFGAILMKVNIQKTNLMELDELAAALCISEPLTNYKNTINDFEEKPNIKKIQTAKTKKPRKT
jgi:hypothetical protein